ncbi:MAG: hypothetical protein VW270_10660 [Candidatus Poseidoniales archaeon]|jgi:hypothetical protein
MFGFVKSITDQIHRKDYVFDHFLRVEYKSDIQAAKKMGLSDDQAIREIRRRMGA